MARRPYLKWYDLFLSCGSSQRKKIKDSVLKALKNFSDKGEGHPDTKAGKDLHGIILEHFKLIGVSPKIEYAKLTGPQKDLDARWEHFFSSPTLLYKHKKLPVLILVNPGIRFDKSFIEEMKFNVGENVPVEMEGIAG